MIKAQFTGENILSNSTEAYTLYEKSRLGEKINSKIKYNFMEALYLLEKEKIEIFSKNKKLDFETLMKKIKRIDKKIEIKFIVFKDLRKKGYIIKTAFKFGADFRVYEKGIKPGEEHAKWIVFITKENEHLNWHEFSSKNRVAHSTRKKLLLAIIDDDEDATYYQCEWIRL